MVICEPTWNNKSFELTRCEKRYKDHEIILRRRKYFLDANNITFSYEIKGEFVCSEVITSYSNGFDQTLNTAKRLIDDYLTL